MGQALQIEGTALFPLIYPKGSLGGLFLNKCIYLFMAALGAYCRALGLGYIGFTSCSTWAQQLW